MKTKTPKRKGPARVQYRHTVAFSAPILPPGPVIQPLVA